MQNKKLIINKDNYKGYVELYNARTYIGKDLLKMLAVFLIGILVFGVTAPLYAFELIGINVITLEILCLCGVEISLAINTIKNKHKMKKNKIYDIKQEYPYVDIKIKDSELEKSLEEAKIITYSEDGCYVELNVNEYENYLKVEEYKEKYFDETKYDKYIVNPKIAKEQFEKPKIKKLVR